MPPIVDDMNLHIRQGETIAIVGPSGGGKTTLAKLLLRLYHPQSGTELNTRGKQCIFCQMLYMSRPFSLSLASRTPILLVTFYYYLLIWLLVNFLFRIYSSGQPWYSRHSATVLENTYCFCFTGSGKYLWWFPFLSLHYQSISFGVFKTTFWLSSLCNSWLMELSLGGISTHPHKTQIFFFCTSD